MARRRKYQLEKVLVSAGESRPATWTFGGTAQQGTEQLFAVTDTNFDSRNQWEFMVRLPKRKAERIEVRPRIAPNVKVWAELPDRSITFMRATIGDARGRRYCQVALADPSGQRSRVIVRGDQRSQLPSWFDGLKGRMRVKENINRTRGTDGKALVLLVAEDDHRTMIRMFFALKVWVVREKFELPQA
jgi:hypothetical protein